MGDKSENVSKTHQKDKTYIEQRNKFDVDEKLESEFNAKHLKRGLKYVKDHRGQLMFALFLSIMSSVLSLMFPYFAKITTDTLIPAGDIKKMVIIALVSVVLIFIIMFANRTRSLITNRVGQTIIAQIRHDLFTHLQKLPFDYYDSRPHGKILVRVVNYVNAVSDFFTNGMVNIILEVINLFAITFFMFMTNVEITFVILAGMIPLAVFMYLTKNAQRRTSRMLSNKTSNMNAYYQESIDGMKITQSFTREDYNQDIAYKSSNDVKDTWMKRVYIMSTISPVVTLMSAFGLMSIYIGGVTVFKDSVTVGVVIAMASYCTRFWQPIQNLGQLYNKVINAVAYLERIFEVMDVRTDIKDGPDAIELGNINGEVSFEHVDFAYQKDLYVLKDFTFTAKKGQSVALVGPTGAGKTTVVNLLCRFYNINSGSVKIDGVDINSATISSLRRQMGIMLQDCFLFSGTIMDNIKYSKLDATDEEAIEAAKTVCAHDFIMELPKGYDTVVSERGASLSAGQRQLISFARTLLADPKILILDEATSAIDTKTELLVQEGLLGLLKGRTSFIIAHRLSTIKNCDQILYIDNKNIAEQGTQEELLKKKGLYYNLYNSQVNDD